MMRTIQGLAAAGVVLAVAGCHDLDIENTNNPDRDIALSRPSDVETLISSSWRGYYQSIHNSLNTYYFYPNFGVEGVTSSNERGSFSSSTIPRAAFNNNPGATTWTDPIGVVESWRAWHEVGASASEGLLQIERGMTFVSGTGAQAVDNTMRAKAFAKFTQGLALGQLAMIFDQATIADETMLPLPGTPAALAEFVRDNLRPYPEVLARALQSFDDAIQLTLQHNVRIPGAWLQLPGELTPQQFAQLVNSYAARHIVYNARTPQERENLDWDRVLAYTANGLTWDFFPVLASGAGNITSGLYFIQQRNDSGCVTCMRASYFVIGAADVSGRYQQWLTGDLTARQPFEIETPDRRITGPTPTTRGAYFTFRPNDFGQGGAPGYIQSRYQWFRNNGVNNAGNAFMFSRTENDLLRAEALARRGQAAAAAELVNLSRTRAVTIPGTTGPGANGTFPNLPPVTAAGVPAAADCVPRTATGACGDLLLAIQYERNIEAFAADATRAYGDARGWGRLPSGTALHLPVPGAELDLIAMPVYTYGGVGGDWAAP